MTRSRSIAIYRAFFRFYPRRFRDDYGPDMALLFAEQLRDEPTGRVWARGVIDLAISVPARHLEAHVNRPPNPTVPIVLAAVAISGLAFAIVGGTNVGVAVIGVALAVVAGVLAVASWRQSRAINAARPASAHWWKLVVGGAAVFIATVVTVNVTGEVSSDWWLPMMLTFVVALTTTITGVILGIAHLTTSRTRHA